MRNETLNSFLALADQQRQLTRLPLIIDGRPAISIAQ
ncbi:hypothetical protein NK6_9277 [Bradyrhizobium diazoefficiens]|uniref:Uncharacterized protein n=1 Tax=Bradyrhizobium diazoefficiens TaxID=1355477 RepID=A0A0E4G128_9BRAD|nr:hypothetical protein NK6_9277 [Bradyrhizobium diazoefficiens]